MPEDEFIKFRLKQGVYGQRQPDVQMIRVKLPFGGVTPEQMEAFADVIEKYVPLNKGHITTRQNIQMHHIPLPEAEKAIRELGEAGLSSREGCGNTVRNVTGDPWAGVAKDELFDMTPYAGAYVRYFVRHPTTQAMPRKIKTAFDGSPRDRAISGIHDIAFRARVREIDGRGEVRGVQMLVGGGTSIMPRVAPVLYEFVELDNGDYLRIAEAVFRIFDRQEWLRVNRARARIKVFVDKYGIDELRNQVEEELEGRLGRRTRLLDRASPVPRRRARVGAGAARKATTSPNGDRSEFERFRAANVAEQKQEGFVTVEVKVTRGDLTPEQFRGLAQIMRTYAGGYARTTRAAELRAALGARGERVRRLEGAVGAGPRRRGLARNRRRGLVPGHRLVQARDHELDGRQPGCAGADRSDGDQRRADAPAEHQDQRLPERLRPAPRRQHRLHGRVDQSRRAHDPRVHPPRGRGVRRRRGQVRHAPEAAPAVQAGTGGGRALDRPLRGQLARTARSGATFVERVGTGELEALVKDLSLPVDFGLETMNEFIDWNRNVPFEVIRGEGECAV